MYQNDAEAMQQNATKLNPIPIPWNRIKTANISSIISKHSTHTKSPHPHHLLSPSPKQVQETHELNPVTPNGITTSKISHPPQVRSYALWSSLNTSSRLHLESTYNLHLKHHSNWRGFWYPVEHLRQSSFAEMINVLRLLAVFAEEPYRGYSTGFSIQLYPIT